MVAFPVPNIDRLAIGPERDAMEKRVVAFRVAGNAALSLAGVGWTWKMVLTPHNRDISGRAEVLCTELRPKAPHLLGYPRALGTPRRGVSWAGDLFPARNSCSENRAWSPVWP